MVILSAQVVRYAEELSKELMLKQDKVGGILGYDYLNMIFKCHGTMTPVINQLAISKFILGIRIEILYGTYRG